MKTIEISVNNIPNQTLVYYIGQNKQENHDLINRSKPTDWWFHGVSISSCHVVADIPIDIYLNKKQLKTIIKHGAILCKKQMSNKLSSNEPQEIQYTQIKHVTNILPIGKVSVETSKIIRI